MAHLERSAKTMKLKIVVFTILVIVGFLWLLTAVAAPALTPLEISDDDPEMKAARAKAQATLKDFVTLYRKYPDGAMVKWPFVTASGQKEYLGAEVLSIDGDRLKIRLVTPPATHTGKLEREYSVHIKDIADWVIVLPGDKRKGGFTMRVMFKVGRKQWGDLPKELKIEESKYVD